MPPLLQTNMYSGSAVFYDLEFGSAKTDDIDFYIELISREKSDVLELCCGTGRITIPIARQGFHITGIDISSEMLSLCSKKLEFETKEVKERTRLLQASMTDFSLPGKYNWILLPFHSFQLLTDPGDIAQALKSVHRHLLDNGNFIINIFKPLDDMKIIEGGAEEKTIQDEGGQILYKKNTINRNVDTGTRTIHYDVEYTSFHQGRIKDHVVDHFKARYYFEDQFTELLTRHNFLIEEQFKGFDTKRRGNMDSPELIYICKKK